MRMDGFHGGGSKDLYSSGSQPGVRGPPLVRDQFEGVRQKLKVVNAPLISYQGVGEFHFFLFIGTTAEKGLEPLLYTLQYGH